MTAAVAERTVVRPNPKSEEGDPVFETELYDPATLERVSPPGRYAHRQLVAGQLEGRSWSGGFADRVKEIYREAHIRHGVIPTERSKMPVDGWNDGSFITRHLRPRKG